MSDSTPTSITEYLQLHPADVADRLQRIPTDEAANVLLQLPGDLAAQSLAELESEQAQELIEHIGQDKLVEFLEKLPHSEATDLVGELAPTHRNRVLAQLPLHIASPVKELLQYPEDTAGGIMSDRFITLQLDDTIQESHERLRRQQDQSPEDISYLYVTDRSQQLIGIVSLRDLVFARPDARIQGILNEDVKCLRVTDDQEEIARQFEHYHYLGLPVLDEENRIVGVVKANDVLQVAKEEATEDMQLMVGLTGEERALTPWHKSVGKRLPWLYINLITAFGAAAVVGLFENTIAQWTVLAVFLPIVAGQGGNAGMQTLTVIIRDLALGELSPGDGRRALLKELVLGLVNGIAIGVVVGILGYLWKENLMLGVVTGCAMVLNQLAAVMSGVMIPYGLKFFNVDPALASSIFVTTITDIAGFFFFLGLAALALQLFA